jgi:hypothetical protein
VKLVVVSTTEAGNYLELRREVNALSVASGLPDQIRTATI